ncbi:MAG: sensor histidine kinase KdpD [Veillonellales bacterium]
MNQETRRDPELLLKKAKQASRGKLTLFLGAAAGVGKTFAMLENAHDRLAEGVDIVIGWVETHGRKETESIAAGLPQIPSKMVEYRGKTLAEMDLEAILARHPQLVLVDELAHTNVPDSRHVRRFQDVEEILNAGINVYTTLNIQHVESLNDIVEQITGIKVRETVPDYIVDQADQVQLIDIPPEDLIKRLKEGKVYVPGQAERALHSFFRPGNINALREMSLRFTAHRVDQQLNEYMHDHAIEGPWSAAEKVLVCVSASPFSAHLIRIAKRMAKAMKAEWYAVHIETLHNTPADDKERERLARNMRLAEDLGGKVMTVSGRNMVDEILTFSHSENITHLVIGKPLHNRFWEWVRGGALVDKLIRSSGGIQIHVIQGKRDKDDVPKVKTAIRPSRVNWEHYAGGLFMLGLAAAVSWLMLPMLELVNIAMLFLLPVLLSAAWWGRGPSYATAVCSVVIFDFLFVPPVLSFTVQDFRYIWTFLIFLLVAFVAGGQTERLRNEARFARKREKMTRALYEFSRKVAALVELEPIIAGLAQTASQALERSVAVFLPNENSKIELKACESLENTEANLVLDPSELAVATWAYEHGEVAGRSTETLPSARFLYLPLIVRGQVMGVMGLHMVEKSVTPEQRRLIDAWTTIAAIAVERIYLTTEANHAALLQESERLQSALFNSISHELRTPLATIIGSISTLLDKEIALSRDIQAELLDNIKDGAIRMERIITNLLDTARLESGAIKIKHDWCDVEDVIGAALGRLGESVAGRQIQVDIPEPLPLIPGDCVLLEQVLVNLVDNAVKYSPADKAIEISASREDQTVMITVADHGGGIPEQDLNHIFDKFYRVAGSRAGGTGLGLSICKGIIEAHGGTIWAANRPENGTRVRFTLPLGK